MFLQKYRISIPMKVKGELGYGVYIRKRRI